MNFARLFCLLIACGLSLHFTSSFNPPSATEKEVSVALAAEKVRYVVGQPIRIRIDIQNIGERDLLICNRIQRITAWVCSLELIVTDENGNESPRIAVMPPLISPARASESFANALVRDWMILAPGHSLSAWVWIDSDTFRMLGQPGRYRIQADYTSQGLKAPLYYNTVSKYQSEIEQLPAKNWVGSATSNTLSIEVVRKRD